jgi:TolB protein
MDAAQIPSDRFQAMQVLPDQVLVGELLQAPLPETDDRPEYRVHRYRPGSGASAVALERAEWAAAAGENLLAVEDGRLRLHQGREVRTLLERASPDFAIDGSGRFVVAVVQNPALPLDTDLVLLPVLGGPARSLVAWRGSREYHPVFTPDNRSVVFVSGRSGLASLWRLDLSGGEPVQLTNRGLTPNGRRPGGYVPPPVERASLRFASDGTLEYEAEGHTQRVDVRGGR